jgi:hypothetical protein
MRERHPTNVLHLVGLLAGVLLSIPALVLGADRSPPQPQAGAGRTRAHDEAQALAAVIDRILAARWAEAKVNPAPRADDAEFLRRLALDLTGKIPTAAEARDFLDDTRPDKREALVDRLLDGPGYLVSATEIWRSMLLPELDTDAQARFLAPTFEAWLRKQVAEDVGYDRIVRSILTMDLGNRAQRGATRLDRRAAPTPAAFYIAKDGKPENLAAGTARVFLGIRLECAQCHNHPFARWKRDEFWGFAAFFAGVTKSGPEDGNGAIRELSGRTELVIPGTDRVVRATFLDGSKPGQTPRSRAGTRDLLAAWITSPENPYFARAAVNRVWARFFGTGLVEPVDDMGEENPPALPELLDEVARQFRAHRYDLKFLIRALAATRAYSLTSAIGRSEAPPPGLFAAMPVRGLSPGQLFASLARATGYHGAGSAGGFDREDPAEARFLELFARRDERAVEAQTSILQALALMNGEITSAATSLERGDTLGAIAEAPYLDTAGRIDSLYLAALSRRPRPAELAVLVAFVDRGGSTGNRAVALADVFWALLNSPEFALNH